MELFYYCSQCLLIYIVDKDFNAFMSDKLVVGIYASNLSHLHIFAVADDIQALNPNRRTGHIHFHRKVYR